MGMSPEERRVRDAARKRAKRAEERAGRAERSADVDASAAPRTMRDALEVSLAAMKWLAASDGTSVAQARALAEDVDVLRHAGDVVKALSAQRALSRVLNDLGGTPTVRMQHELRSLKLRGGGDGEGDEAGPVEPAGNVTSIKRPAKRARA